MAYFTNGGTVKAGFTWPEGDCVATATVSWDSDFYVTISNVKYSYANGDYLPVECKWRVKPYAGGSVLAGYTDDDYLGDSFSASENVKYTFQACVSGTLYYWGNSLKEEGTDGSSYFTVRRDSGGGDSGGGTDTPEQYAITYDAKGGTGAPSTHFKTEGEVVYLSNIKPIKNDEDLDPYVITFDANGGECSIDSLIADRIKHFKFDYWNTKSNGSGITYHPGESYTYDAPLKLYAIYSEDTVTKSVELPAAVRGGYEFLGWSIDKNAETGITGAYEPGENTTFYAVWKEKGLLYVFDGAEFGSYQVFIYDGSNWDLYCPYMYDSEWSLCS